MVQPTTRGSTRLSPCSSTISIENKNIVQWNTDGVAGKVRVGFMSQVSPDGRYVVSTFAGSSSEDISNTYYVTNFKDYRFLQVFYPTRGILEWYSRDTGKREPCRGPTIRATCKPMAFGVLTVNGSCSRGRARKIRILSDRRRRCAPTTRTKRRSSTTCTGCRSTADAAGVPEPIAGASSNGMSNNFPKVSPDGRWIVFVQCRNGQLMRPDSQLYIVPFEGGAGAAFAREYFR